MIKDFDKILNELSYRVKDGTPDLTNEQHLIKLFDVLKEHDWPIDERVRVIHNLTNEEKIGPRIAQKKMQSRIAGLSSDLSTPTNPKRIGNDGDLSDQQFTNLLQGEFGSEVKMVKPLTGQNKSSKFNMFLFSFEGNDYDITLAGKVSGRGTAQTKDQELAFLLSLSAIHAGANTNNKEEFLSMMLDPSVYGEVYDGSSISENDALGLVSFLENNDDWYKSTLAQTKKLAGQVGSSPKKYLKDDSKLDINKLAKQLYKDEYQDNLDLDKWNPADVWLYYTNSVPTFKSLAELNNYLLDSIKKGNGIIGISLKKGSGNVSVVNDGKKKEYELKNLGLKIGGLFKITAYLEFSGKGLDGLGLQFRIFQGSAKEPIRGEATTKGADAVQGKVALPVLDLVSGQRLSGKIKKLGGEDILDYDKKSKEFSFSKNGLKKYKEVSKLWNKIKSKVVFARGAKSSDYSNAFKSPDNFLDMLNKLNLAENKAKAVLNSRFQTIALLSYLGSMNRGKQADVAIGLLKYGKSQSDWSSAHLKVQ